MRKNRTCFRAERNRDFAPRGTIRNQSAVVYKHFVPPALLATANRVLTTIFVVFLSAFFSTTVNAQARRVVILKVDGLPFDTVDRFVRERDPQTGKSRLPWF